MQQEKKRFYQAKWFLWLWMICFPPVGLILLWTCHKGMRKNSRNILSAVFAVWFAILMIAVNGDSPTAPVVIEEGNESMQEENESPGELTVQDIEDACNSFFTDIAVNAYNEIPWGAGTENGIKIDSTNLGEDLKSGEVIVSYTLLDSPHSGTSLIIKFSIDDERVGVLEILVDGTIQEIPEEAKDSVLIWLLLDVNYEG